MLSAYVNRFGGVGRFGLGIEKMLENWNKGKSVRLNQLFDGKLILEKEVKFEKALTQIEREFDEMHMPFTGDFYDFVYRIEWLRKDYDTMWAVRRMTYPESLAENRVREGFILVNPEGKKLRVDKGQKLMGAIKKTGEFLGMDMERFEDFRLECSRVLNDKLVKGTMCLSIHPFDYMTLSDNNHGWESCMSWINEGCYRAGTLEVMNCDNTIVAYLKSADDDFTFSDHSDEYKWSSKKWRQLIHVTDKVIMSNKPYPFFHDKMTEFCLEWIKELSEKNLGLEYNSKLFDYDHMDGTEVENITLWGSTYEHMYNDLDNGSESKFYVVKGEENGKCNFTIGDAAFCLECGCHMDRENGLTCYDCSGEFYCDCCDDNCSGDAIETADGTRVCEYCYDHYYYSCEGCGDVHHHREIEYYEDEICEGRYCDHCRATLEQQEEERKQAEEDEKAKEQLLAIQPVE